MGFFSRAWESAGHEYGRQNAARYARVARLAVAVRILFMLLGVCFLIAMYHLGQAPQPMPATPPPTIPTPTLR